MNRKLTREEVTARLAEVGASLPRQACRSCDCFQGYLTQLALDAEEDVADLIAPWQADRAEMHGCLGCAPCPPGDAFARYLKKEQDES